VQNVGEMSSVEEGQQAQAEDWSRLADNLLREIASLHPHVVDDVRRAIAFSYDAHAGQVRESGDPYIVHPLEVAAILTDLQMDASSIIAAILHDTLEDCGVPVETLEREFG